MTGVTLVLAIAVGISLVTIGFGKRALVNSQRELTNTAVLVASHVDQLFEQIELVQNGMIGLMRAKGIDAADEFEREMSSYEMHLRLGDRAASLSYLEGTSLYRPDGTLLNSSGAWPPPKADISDREYFQKLLADPGLTKVVSIPLRSRVTGTSTIVLARRFVSNSGELLGIVVSGIKTQYFARFFDTILVGNCCSISLLRSDGILLVRSPPLPNGIGRVLPFAKLAADAHGPKTVEVTSKRGLDPIFRAVTSLWEADQNVRRIPGELNVDRLLVADRSSDFPLFVTMGGDIDAILSDWYQQAKVFAVGTALFLLVIAVVFGLIIRKLLQQHRSSEQALLDEKARLDGALTNLDTALNNMTQGLVLLDSDARFVISNERYISMYGLSPEIVKPGAALRDVICERQRSGSFDADIDVEKYVHDLLALVRRGVVSEAIRETPDGRIFHIVNKPLANGGFVATHEDVTERRRAEERIAYLALHDGLTGLPNRMAVRDRLQQALSRARRDEVIAVLYLDLDDFKSVNDSVGHPTGDALLMAAASRLTSIVRGSDIVARLGGDEFAIIQSGLARSSDVIQLVARIQNALREPFQIDSHEIVIDSSIGIAIHPGDGDDPDTLFKNADLALYGAKAAGGRTYMFFEAEMDARFKARRTLEIDLRQAITSDELEIHYQPIVSCRSGTITGCEALLRWCHPKRGWIAPAEFIPIAEETGLINAIGDWVVRNACKEAATWPQDVTLAVNVSPMQFKNRALALIVVNALSEAGFSPNRLELEITEAVLMRDEDASSSLRELRALGVRIALDDFGTGYSSLSYLLKFPFDKIKIDRCFTEGIAADGGSRPIVQAVIDIAKSRNIATTAEGVETEVQLAELRALGCTEAQGYLISRALPREHIRQLLFTDKSAIGIG